jgi:hypothetical protein
MARARTGTIFSDAFAKFRGGTSLDDDPREGRKATSALRARIAELYSTACVAEAASARQGNSPCGLVRYHKPSVPQVISTT